MAIYNDYNIGCIGYDISCSCYYHDQIQDLIKYFKILIDNKENDNLNE